MFSRKIPERIRLPTLTAIYGVVSGLVTVAFMLTVNTLFVLIWHRLAGLGRMDFVLAGSQPSFLMPAVDASSWNMYLVVPVAALLSSLAGVFFQRGALGLRLKMRQMSQVPPWLRPLLGGLVTWVIGCAVFLICHRLGVFGLGYDDLSDALLHGIGWKLAGVLAVAKIIATLASYGTGGCGGIFSPTLFIGAMCGFFTAGVAKHWIPLTPADELVLAATGMSACFGAIVRTPFTSILMIFEMTHQFGMVPALMLGTLISQAVARLAGHSNFYEEVLLQDGHEIHKIAPPQDLTGWHNMPVSVLANKKPVSITSLAPTALKAALVKHPYRCFPVMINDSLLGLITRDVIEHALALGSEPELEEPVIFLANQSLQEVEPQMIESTVGLFLVAETEGAPVTGIFTLHDLMRAQAALTE